MKRQATTPLLGGLLVIVLIIGSLGSKDSVAEVYKWVDAQGKTHYGNRPGAESAQTLKIDKAPHVDVELQQRQQRQQKVSDSLEQESKAIETERQAQAKQRATQQANCKLARQQLKEYETATYLYDPPSKTSKERRIYSHEERQQAMVESRQAVAEWCDD